MRVTILTLIYLLLTGQAFAFTDVPEKYRDTKELSDLPGMAIEGPKYMIGAVEVKGVKGVAYVNDLRREMAKYGLNKTHHLMVGFTDISSGELIEIGSVAVKIKSSDNKAVSAIELLPMAGGFGADVALQEKGTYQITVGTELNDGQKRVFIFGFENQ